MQYSIQRLELGQMQNFIYLIGDNASRSCAVIDPAWDAAAILAAAKSRDLRIEKILLTHSHHDHVNAVGEIMQSGAQLYLSHAEAQFWQKLPQGAHVFEDGARINIGKLDVEAIITQGHTPGSCCYLIGNDLFTGDTLFINGCGRCDFTGSDVYAMYHSLQKLKSRLSADTCIYPGHDYGDSKSATWQQQLDHNPFLLLDNPELFAKFRLVDHAKMRHQPFGKVDANWLEQYKLNQ